MKTIPQPRRRCSTHNYTLCRSSIICDSYMVANRSVDVGLTASAVISSWLYSTALLGTSLLTYRYGLALGVCGELPQAPWSASCPLSLSKPNVEPRMRIPYSSWSKSVMEPLRIYCGSFYVWSTISSYSRVCYLVQVRRSLH
jgi:hypothetical protein